MVLLLYSAVEIKLEFDPYYEVLYYEKHDLHPGEKMAMNEKNVVVHYLHC